MRRSPSGRRRRPRSSDSTPASRPNPYPRSHPTRSRSDGHGLPGHLPVPTTSVWASRMMTTPFSSTAFGVLSKTPVVLVPSKTVCRPVDPGEVADRPVELAQGAPAGRVADTGGPRVYEATDPARSWADGRRPAPPDPARARPGQGGRRVPRRDRSRRRTRWASGPGRTTSPRSRPAEGGAIRARSRISDTRAMSQLRHRSGWARPPCPRRAGARVGRSSTPTRPRAPRRPGWRGGCPYCRSGGRVRGAATARRPRRVWQVSSAGWKRTPGAPSGAVYSNVPVAACADPSVERPRSTAPVKAPRAVGTRQGMATPCVRSFASVRPLPRTVHVHRRCRPHG